MAPPYRTPGFRGVSQLPRVSQMKWIASLSSVACLSGVLFSPAAPVSSPVAAQVSCPETCIPSLVEDASQAIQGACAYVYATPGPATAGEATANCVATCSVCDQLVTVSWVCSGACGFGTCTYVWESVSYDRNGNAKPKQTGTGQGGGSATQTLTSPCRSGESSARGWIGVSVAGTRRVWRLACGC
jgi:hypothetical protein